MTVNPGALVMGALGTLIGMMMVATRNHEFLLGGILVISIGGFAILCGSGLLDEDSNKDWRHYNVTGERRRRLE